VTAAERLAEAEERLECLEADRDRLLTVVEGLVAAVELLARAAGARVPAKAEPARAALRLIRGDADRGAQTQ
jgi:hypothetical protein